MGCFAVAHVWLPRRSDVFLFVLRYPFLPRWVDPCTRGGRGGFALSGVHRMRLATLLGPGNHMLSEPVVPFFFWVVAYSLLSVWRVPLYSPSRAFASIPTFLRKLYR
ncbi:hypothetical protein, unlikely [Trypanosoma brucei gambiense DAL972]|uniref:Uncharacterized protein n=1 Tax=Trypanosoma brucei gambiense (strain MHOM/CI/86/DAL972) TaxID=679716 RepID=C9ZIS9_TRYB9|nr:hypothetical protein, unlikely [Trypanosoma brucei gambiense DAL972]CBH09071.1 hypothetical protein, unlikely [Trypanosoma brucei gambiense DAL972]|eukprot:XP_011771512.1 hypothetical protein, unlikely [Trypanosoma brucei gambiense DAL972]